MALQEATLVVVGDRFAGFSAQEGVLTVTQFLAELHVQAPEPGTRTVVRAGQGVGDFEWDLLCDRVRARGLEDSVTLERQPADLASRAECHKSSEPNALIANLSREGERTFTASLRLHNDNELLLDHQTGEHVQGMVAVEAARQMFLAVTERYFASAHPQRRYYYVIDAMNTDFENFLFPLDAGIEYEVESADLNDPERLSFTVRITLVQGGRTASVTAVEFTAFDESRLKPIEHRRAAKAVGQVHDALREPAGV